MDDGRRGAVTLLLPEARLDERRRAAEGPLAPLADALRAELAPLLAGEPFIPEAKARLTRAGGRCPRDGAQLDFDPGERSRHRCPRCGGRFTGEAHDGAWVAWYQLWLAERCVHGALLALLRRDEPSARFARETLARLADRYERWPNRDNVLGPSRPFFSTYLESIWLLQLVVATDLLERAGCDDGVGGQVRERLVAPSARLVASFPEGASNRQVWNDAALLASALLLGDRAEAERRVHGEHGISRQLASGLLVDGSWYEGENYHLFAHRGLWYGVVLAEVAGIPIAPALLERFQEGFATPFLTALPDFTFPARRDSQHGISLRQWRFAELAELGLARRDDVRLRGALATIYDPSAPAGDTGRWRSTAEAERNAAPARLARSDLGWRSLLHALPDPGPLVPAVSASALLEGQGFAVLRRERGRVYLALDYGHSGGGHGHPDRLNLLWADGAARWLDDYGTGSYVERSLHWYRSTLAHGAPLVDGRSQSRVDGRLVAFEERGGAAWVSAEVREIAPDVVACRTLVAMPDYALDLLEWSAPRAIRLELPLHIDGTLDGVRDWQPATLEGGDGLEDGFDFVRDAERAREASSVARLTAARNRATAALWVAPGVPVEWWRATAPGAPGQGDARFHLLRATEAEGSLALVLDWSGTVRRVDQDIDGIVVELQDGARHAHRRDGERWHIDLTVGGARSSIDLGGWRRPPRAAPRTAVTDFARPPRDVAGPLRVELGAAHYRRTEESWEEAGRPTADVTIALGVDALVVQADVRAAALVFVPAGAVNELDNEHPDINGHGAQVYLRRYDASGSPGPVAAWLAVPEAESERVRLTPIAGRDSGLDVQAAWSRTSDGYRLRFVVPRRLLDAGKAGRGVRVDLDLLLNETAPGRERRRGQLALSGGGGEYLYLRGDRHPPERLLHLRFLDD